MSWLFSQALVAEYSAENCSAGEQSAQLNVTDMPQAYCVPNRMTAFSRLSRFRMTFAPLTADRGEELLTWFLGDSHVKTLASQGEAVALRAAGQVYGRRWPESSVRFDLDGCIWKTHHCLFAEELHWSLVILPRWGMTANGVVFQHPMLERPISEIGSGLSEKRPTPTVCGNYNRKGASMTSGDGLATMVMKFPTPTRSDCKGSGPSMLRKDGKMRGDRLDYFVERNQEGLSAGGRLNPTWVEWLMGWPQGWTDLKPLGMDKYREWLQEHSIS